MVTIIESYKGILVSCTKILCNVIVVKVPFETSFGVGESKRTPLLHTLYTGTRTSSDT